MVKRGKWNRVPSCCATARRGVGEEQFEDCPDCSRSTQVTTGAELRPLAELRQAREVSFQFPPVRLP